MSQYCLSTRDNPWNPFTNFREWFATDIALGHNTAQFLDRQFSISPEIGKLDADELQEMAIDEIIKRDPLGMYIKVKEPGSGEEEAPSLK